MKMKNLLAGAAVAGSFALMSATASATILDAWQLDDSGGVTTNIGHLVVSGGQATITQELNAGGNIFVGARFSEFGGLFSLTYTPESCMGGCDFGPASVLAGGSNLDLQFTGLEGTVTSVNGTSFGFGFTPGVGTIALSRAGNQLATFEIASPSGGTLANFFGAVNTSGTSNIFAKVLTSDPGVFRDSLGNFLDSAISNGELFVALDTTNQIFTPAIGAPCPASFVGAAGCSQIVVTSQGKIDALVNVVPEPASLALVGMGLVGLAGLRKRKSFA